MERKPRSYRFNENVISEIQELTSILNTSETEAVSRAVHFYLTFLRNEEDFVKQKAVVSLSEYQNMQQQMQNQISQLLFRLGESEGKNAEKDQTIQTLRSALDKLIEAKQKQDKEKGFWRIFWWATRKEDGT